MTVLFLYLRMKEINRLNPLQYQRGWGRKKHFFNTTQSQSAQSPHDNGSETELFFLNLCLLGPLMAKVKLEGLLAGREIFLSLVAGSVLMAMMI